jgi:hypothetical protein
VSAKAIMDAARKLAQQTHSSKGLGGFGSVKEMEVSFFIMLVCRNSSMSDDEVVDLVVRSYGLSKLDEDLVVRPFLRDFRRSQA